MAHRPLRRPIPGRTRCRCPWKPRTSPPCASTPPPTRSVHRSGAGTPARRPQPTAADLRPQDRRIAIGPSLSGLSDFATSTILRLRFRRGAALFLAPLLSGRRARLTTPLRHPSRRVPLSGVSQKPGRRWLATGHEGVRPGCAAFVQSAVPLLPLSITGMDAVSAVCTSPAEGDQGPVRDPLSQTSSADPRSTSAVALYSVSEDFNASVVARQLDDVLIRFRQVPRARDQPIVRRTLCRRSGCRKDGHPVSSDSPEVHCLALRGSWRRDGRNVDRAPAAASRASARGQGGRPPGRERNPRNPPHPLRSQERPARRLVAARFDPCGTRLATVGVVTAATATRPTAPTAGSTPDHSW